MRMSSPLLSVDRHLLEGLAGSNDTDAGFRYNDCKHKEAPMGHARTVALLASVVTASLSISSPGSAALLLGSAQIVQAAGADILVPGYSVPSWVDWNGDGLKDLVVGQGGGASPQGKVRVYLNVGTGSQPAFSGFVYAQSGASDLVVTASGCLGIFPRVVYWDADARKDLLAGEAQGKVRLFTNTGLDSAPVFDAGVYLQVGPPGGKADIAVGARATPTTVDWNGDGKKDLVVGAMDGKVRVYVNEGTDSGPDFRTVQYAQDNGVDLVVPTGRSSPCLLDLDDDGNKDLLTGNTAGQLLFYHNVGTDQAPAFSGYVYVPSAGIPIDLAGDARSRPFVCDWAGDPDPDVLIGSSDGLVRLYEGEYSSAVESPAPGPGYGSIRLLAAYPNPTRSTQTYRIELLRAERVRISIFDADGRVVRRLLNADLPAGRFPFRWDSTDEAGRLVAGGVYYLELQSGGTRVSRSLVVARGASR
jgi:hypothetical protein